MTLYGLPRFKDCLEFRGKECSDVVTELFGAKKGAPLTKAEARLKEMRKQHCAHMQAKLNTVANFKMKFGEQIQPQRCLSDLIYPEAGQPSKLVLLMPDNDASASSIDPVFKQAEYLGLGTIRHEYEVDKDYFYLWTYFCENEKPRLCIRRIAIPYQASKLYDADENIQHFWYGGRYPKDNDRITPTGNVEKIICGLATATSRHRFITSGFNEPYPPIAEYPAARDAVVKAFLASTPVSNIGVAKARVAKLVDDFYAQERIKFCNRFAEQSEPSKSKIFKTIQELDVQFKLLDSFLTFMYNELMYDPKDPEKMRAEFVALHDNQVTFLKDEEALNRYFEQYAQQGTKLCEQEFALAYLQQTQDKMAKTFEGIMGLRLKAEFAQVMNVVKGLKEALAMYSGRMVIPVKIDTQSEQLILMQKQLDQRDKELMLRDKEFALLAQDRTRLTKVMETTRQKIDGLQEQMRQMMEMLMKTQGSKT
jgi:hypothetical protein